MKHQQVKVHNSEHISAENRDKRLDFSTTFMELGHKKNPGNPDKFFRDTG